MTTVSNPTYSNIFTGVTNPVYSKADNSTIDCLVTTANGVLPFTASAHDCMPYGVALYNDLASGVYGAIAAYVPH